MNVVLYSTGCPQCMVLEKKLEMKGIPFTKSDDFTKVIEAGYKTAPVLEVEGDLMTFGEANKWINDRQGA